MVRYKPIDSSPRFLAVDLARQLMPGTLAFAIDWLIDHRLDLSGFDARYGNDAAGAPAYPPAMLLKPILVAYSRGIVGSRGKEPYGRRFATVKPVFANIRHNKGLDRFILRGAPEPEGRRGPASVDRKTSG